MKPSAVLKGKRIAVIGGGNMGQAILRGLLAGRFPATQLVVVEARASTAASLSARLGIHVSTLEHAAARCQILLIAVKPQDVVPLLVALRRQLPAGRARTLIISIAAGLTTRALERRLGGLPVVRVMPNLPAKVGQAVSAITAGRRARREHLTLAAAIFRSVGEVIELPERFFDAVTAISGSGPAYLFVILQALRDAGVRRGLPKAVAERLAVQTAFGSLQLIRDLGEELDALITQVASKRGTTEAALRVFKARGLARIIDAGVAAATRRSKELSWWLSAN